MFKKILKFGCSDDVKDRNNQQFKENVERNFAEENQRQNEDFMSQMRTQTQNLEQQMFMDFMSNNMF